MASQRLLRLFLSVVLVCILLRIVHSTIYSGLFTHFSDLADNYCAGDGLLFSETGLRFFSCIIICYRYKQQSCVGIFYMGTQQHCFVCSRMNSTYLLPMDGAVAWKRPSKYLHLCKFGFNHVLVKEYRNCQFSIIKVYRPNINFNKIFMK